MEDRFAAVAWKKGPHGAPVFGDVSAWFDCSMHKTIEAGDHVILIGRVEAYEASTRPGLGYAQGAYVTAAAEAEALASGASLIVSALIARNGEVLLVDDGSGGRTLPEARVSKEGASAALQKLIQSCGIEAEPGFIYSVYEDGAREHQHISFLCQSAAGDPARGAFCGLGTSTLMDIADPAMRIMLERYEAERPMGNFGVYFGNQRSGTVRPVMSGS